MTLLDLLKSRLQVAKSFTKPFHEMVEKSIGDYELVDNEQDKLEALAGVSKRYSLRIPYIFATLESMKSSMFERVPDLVISQKGAMDEEKANMTKAAYDYLDDKLDLQEFMNQSSWWFILSGFCSAHSNWKAEYTDAPMLDETGQPMMDETGEPMQRASYTYNDPVLNVGNPLEEYYSAESKFTNDASGVPYLFTTALMEREEIKALYGVDVESDETIKLDKESDKKVQTDDINRVRVYFYYGRLSKEVLQDEETPNKELVNTWAWNQDYYAIFSNTKVIYIDEIDKKNCCLGAFYRVPTKFFGFGLGKTLAPFQKELSIRRGQQLRMADLYAYAKLAVPDSYKGETKDLTDSRAGVVITFDGAGSPPSYLQPPEMPQTLIVAEEKAREDAQFVSGMLDLSKGAQDTNTVTTATGQQMFAKAAEKRVEEAKRQYGRFYRAVVIMLLKLCQQNWEEGKVLDIMDKDGNTGTMEIGASFKEIDFNKDVDIDMESISVNKEVLRAQAIDFYTRIKDDQLVDRAKILKDVIKDGFNKKNPDNYILPPEQRMQQPMASAEGAGAVASSQSGVIGANGV